MASTPPVGSPAAARRKKLLISSAVGAAIVAAILLITYFTVLQRAPETQPPVGPGPGAKWNPQITSVPPTEAEKGKFYSYAPRANETVVWELSSNATWLSISQGVVQGTPDKEKMWYTVSLKAINRVEGKAWQNYTVRVKAGPEAPPEPPPPEELPPGGPPGLYVAYENLYDHLQLIDEGLMPEAARKGQENALSHVRENLLRWLEKHGESSSSESLDEIAAEMEQGNGLHRSSSKALHRMPIDILAGHTK